MHKEKDDKELLGLFRTTGKNEWLGYLLERYTMLLFGVCMKYLKDEEEAKDAVQQIFIKVISELNKYDVEYFKSWLYMVAKNHCLMKLRGRQNHTTEINEKLLSAEEDDKSTMLEKEMTFEHLSMAMLQLNEEQKICITMFYLDKKSYQQISEATGYSLMQVKSHIQNGKRNLRIHMERLNHER